jgi:hypothetical protein
VVYSRKINGKTYTFGVSGRLYKSNVLFYDHQTESLWSQLLSKAVTGDMAGTELSQLNSSRVKWKTWHRKNPETLVVSTDTGYRRDYTTDPYEGYYRIGTIWFPVGEVRKDLPPKARILGIKIEDSVKAYPLEKLQKEKGTIKDMLGGVAIQIKLNDDGEVVEVVDGKGKIVHHIFSYWFAWQSFYPATTVY